MNEKQFAKENNIDLSKTYTFQDFYDRFQGKEMYERVLVNKGWVLQPTNDNLALRLILKKQGHTDEQGRSMTAYFRL
jgi:hypothetical protein